MNSTVQVDAIELARLRNDAAAWHVMLRDRPKHDRLRPPVEYRSAAYDQLPRDSPERIEAIYAAANRWAELIASPHVSSLLSEWAEWHERRDMSHSTAGMAVLVDWRQLSNTPTFAELERRRSTYDTAALTPEQIREQAAAGWASFEKGAAA